MTKRLIVFLHGLGGDKNTWARFPELLRADPEISAMYFDIDNTPYETSLIKATCSLSEIAHTVSTRLKARIDDEGIDEVAFIAHSQGGILARRIICNWLATKEIPPPLVRLITFATPHWGAYSEYVPKISKSLISAGVSAMVGLPVSPDIGPNTQILELAYDSPAILELNRDWVRLDAAGKVGVKYVAAMEDAVVTQTSALGADFDRDHVLVPGYDHRTIVKPENIEHPSFNIAKAFLKRISGVIPFLDNPDLSPANLQLFDKPPKDSRLNRFVYRTRFVPLSGRDQEIKRLEEFLHGTLTESFQWILIKGSGGVGKSRLALELCHAWNGHWHSGFLNALADQPDWSRWQPHLPTLIVVDYATANPQRVNSLLKGLSDRDSPRSLRRPVRLILLDRSVQDQAINRIVGFDSGSTAIRDARADDLTLASTIDPFLIMESHAKRLDNRTLDRSRSLQALERTDPEKRPLYAILIAEVLSETPELVDRTRDELLDHIIAREKERHWLPAAANDVTTVRRAETTLVAATMVGSTPLPEILSSYRLSEEKAQDVLCAMTNYELASQTVYALEPDPLGERLVINNLIATWNKNEPHPLISWAWEKFPSEVARFFLRSLGDFMGKDVVDLFCSHMAMPEKSMCFWRNSAADAIGILGQGQEHELAAMVWTNLAAAHFRATSEPDWNGSLVRGRYNFIKSLCDVGNIEGAKSQYQELKKTADAHPSNSEYRSILAQAGFNLVRCLTSLLVRDFQYAETIVRQTAMLLDQHKNEWVLRGQYLKCAVEIGSAYAANGDASEARSQYRNIVRLFKSSPRTFEIAEARAMLCANMVLNFGLQRRFQLAINLMSDLENLAKDNHDELFFLQALTESARHLSAALNNDKRHDDAKGVVMRAQSAEQHVNMKHRIWPVH